MCNITIDEVVGISTSQSQEPDRIEVKGTAVNCAQFTVMMENATTSVDVNVAGGSGPWTAEFHASTHYEPKTFLCGHTTINIHAKCVAHPSCTADDSFPLECRPEQVACPTVSLEVWKIHDTCTNGKRSVELKATLSNIQPDTVANWDFGNGQYENFVLNESDTEISRTQSYAPGQNYLSKFEFSLPQGCVGDDLDIGPELDACPPQCATGEIEIVDGPNTECINGKRQVTLRFTLTAGDALPVTAAVLDFGDETGNSLPIMAEPGETVSSDDFLSEPIVHDYVAADAGGAVHEYTPKIIFTPEEDGCVPVKLEIPISISPCESECDEYSISDMTLAQGDCVDNKRQISVTVTTEGADAPTSYKWVWSDGYEDTTTVNSAHHEFEVLADVDASVAVYVTWPNGCTDFQTKPFTVTACEEEIVCPEINNIIATEGNCSTSGEERAVTLTVQVTGQTAGVFTWDFGDGTAATTPGFTALPHNYEAPGTYTVTVSVSGPSGCEAASFSQPINVTACRNRPVPRPRPSPWCPILRIGGLAFLIIGLVLIFGGACSSNVAVMAMGVAMAVVGFGLLVAWAILCGGARGGCQLLQSIIEFLGLLLMLIGVLAAIFGILALFGISIPCALGVIIDGVIVGFVLAVLNAIFAQLGCQIVQPTLYDRLLRLRVDNI